MDKKRLFPRNGLDEASSAGAANASQTRPVETTYDLSEMQPWREVAVILHNDEKHSMMEVVIQIMKALACSYPLAHSHMLRAHNKGKTTLTIVSRERALEIASVLKQIELSVTLRQIN